MYLKAEQIEEYASRFVEIPEKRTFPMNGEVFARFIRKRPDNPNVSDEEGWVFGGYGICQGYELNEEAKPLGRSLWWRYLELNSFPPTDGEDHDGRLLRAGQTSKNLFSLAASSSNQGNFCPARRGSSNENYNG